MLSQLEDAIPEDERTGYWRESDTESIIFFARRLERQRDALLGALKSLKDCSHGCVPPYPHSIKYAAAIAVEKDKP